MSMRNLVSLLLSVMFAFSCALTKSTNFQENTLLTLAGDTVTADEFIYLYEKNNFNNDSIYTEEDFASYLELFANFKLKVRAAKDAGIDTTKAFKSEFTTYKDQLIRPYMAEAVENERLVKEAYDHMKFEVDAAHIMVSVKPDALPEDTLAAYNKLDVILKSARSGMDFEELAFQYSEDPSAKTNKGRLGYFTAFQMVYPFEYAAYNTPVDSISGILRSQFGFHVLKVLDKRPYSGKVKVSHIMLLKSSGSEESLRNKIFEIHEQATGGADWNELCKKFSEDERTKDTGGTLPLLGLRQINDLNFEDTAFGLKEPGEISDPVQSQFGWHIIRLEEKVGLESFEQLKESITQQVSKDERSRLSQRAVVSKLKQTLGFTEDTLVRRQLTVMADSSVLQGKWIPKADSALLRTTLYTLDQQAVSVSETLNYIISNQRRRSGLSPAGYFNELIDKSIEKSLLETEERQLVASNRDLRLLLREYYEGILLFDMMNKQVWGRAVEDTVGLKQFYEDNRDKYLWGVRADAYMIETASEKVFREVKNQLENPDIILMEKVYNEPIGDQAVEYPTIDSIIAVSRNFPGSIINLQFGQGLNEEVKSKMLHYLQQNGVSEESIVTVNKEATEKKVTIRLTSQSKKSLEYLYNRESALTLRVTEGLFERGKIPALDTLLWEKGLYETRIGNEFGLIGIREILPAQPKKFEETKGAVISDYQLYLEQEWIRELKQKNAIVFNERTIDQIKSYFRKRRHSSV